MSYAPKKGDKALFVSVITAADGVPVKVMSEPFSYDGRQVVVAQPSKKTASRGFTPSPRLDL